MHSLCVAKEQQRKGFGLRIIRTYINYVKSALPQVDSIKLICKQVRRFLIHFSGVKSRLHFQIAW